MPFTLADYGKQAKRGGDAISARIISDLQRESRIMDSLTFKSVGSLAAYGTRWQSLPGAAFRKVNSGYTDSNGRTEQIKETLALLGGDLVMDRIFEKVTDVIEDPVVTQMKISWN